jgi:hypothetical protein
VLDFVNEPLDGAQTLELGPLARVDRERLVFAEPPLLRLAEAGRERRM